MDIHQQIKAARERKGWSMQRLAQEISEAEGLQKPLSWQTVQQWERGDSAPARRRMALVLRILEIDGRPGVVSEAPAPTYGVLPPEYRELISDLEDLDDETRAELMGQVNKAAAAARKAHQYLQAKEQRQGKVAAARRSHTTRRATTSMKWGDGNRQQGSLPLLVPARDPFTAAPSEREAKFYERVEHAPKAAEA